MLTIYWMYLSCIFRQLDKHNRLTGVNIEKDRIELWEESKDGSGKLQVFVLPSQCRVQEFVHYLDPVVKKANQPM